MHRRRSSLATTSLATNRSQLAKRISSDWNATTQATTLTSDGVMVVDNPNQLDAAGRCKEKLLLLQTATYHDCAQNACAKDRNPPPAELQNQMRVLLGTANMNALNKTGWYGPGYDPQEFGLPVQTSVIHKAGLLAVPSGSGRFNYVCAGWTAVCTNEATQCNTENIILGGGETGSGLHWTDAVDFSNVTKYVAIPASQ